MSTMNIYKQKQNRRNDLLIAALQDLEPNTLISGLRNPDKPWKQEILATFRLDCPEIPKLHKSMSFYLTIEPNYTGELYSLKKAISVIKSSFSSDKTEAFRFYLTNIFSRQLSTLPIPEDIQC